MNHDRLHNPKYSGPGIWFTIHTLAAEAKTDNDKKDVIKHIRCLQRKFPCAECKDHFGAYLEKHPPEETLGKAEDSLFLWTVNFHNAVNYRLKKPQVSYEEAKSIYTEDNIFCTAKCDEEENNTPNTNLTSSKVVKLVPKDIPSYLL
jgi:hypothetical protein